MFPGEGLIGGLIAGSLNYAGARATNKANQKMAREQMGFQRQSNQEQMQFQERMSNTAYQRSVADLEKAGLNPMLAYMQGGSSSPSGSSSGGSSAHMENAVGQGVSAAIGYRQASAGIEQTKALTKLAMAELPEKEASAKLFGSAAGPWIKMLQLLIPAINSAGSVAKVLKRVPIN